MNSRLVKCGALLLAVQTSLLCSFPAIAQGTNNNNFGVAPMRAAQGVDKLADALDAYFAKNKLLPRTEGDMDKFLVDNYEPIMGVPVPSQDVPRPSGNCRTLNGIAIWVDPRVSSLVKVNNVWQFPTDWNSPQSLSIVTDGARNYVVYLAQQGKPGGLYRVGQNNQAAPTAGPASDPFKPLTSGGEPESAAGSSKPAQKPGDFDFGLGKPAGSSILSPN